MAFLISLLLSYFILELHSNGILSGIALNTLASGGTIFLLFLITGEKGASTSLHSLKLPALNIPLIENIPLWEDSSGSAYLDLPEPAFGFCDCYPL